MQGMRQANPDKWRRRDDRQFRIIIGGLSAETAPLSDAAELARARSQHPSVTAIDDARQVNEALEQHSFYAWWDTWSS
jgi:hypothetical protein